MFCHFFYAALTRPEVRQTKFSHRLFSADITAWLPIGLQAPEEWFSRLSRGDTPLCRLRRQSQSCFILRTRNYWAGYKKRKNGATRCAQATSLCSAPSTSS